MKTNISSHAILLTLLAALTAPIQLPAQQHHHYKLIDLGTFGGPRSYVNPGSGQDVGNFAMVLSNAGALTGSADTFEKDPFPSFCFNEDCFVSHTFEWKNGVKTDLGALPGGASSASNWITPNGLIVGLSENGKIDPLVPGFPQLRATLWRDSAVIDLGTLPEGGFESIASAANNRGQVVGLATNTIADPNSMLGRGFQTRAFLWEDGQMQELGTLGTGTDAQAILISDRGQVVGWSYTSSEMASLCAFPLATGSFVWDKEKKLRDLGNLGGTCTMATDMNSRGQIVGSSSLPGDTAQHAFLWDEGLFQDLGGSLGGDFLGAFAINNAGKAVGFAYLPGDATFHATLWKSVGTLIDLGVVGADSASYAASINAKSQVVGSSGDFVSTARVFLWEDGAMSDLNALITPSSSFHLEFTQTINDRGEIAGTGMDAVGNEHAFLAIPCDEDHPDVEGCDYSLVDPTVVETSARSDSVGAASPLNPQLQTSDPARQFHGSLGLESNPINQLFRRRLSFAHKLVAPRAIALTSTALTSGPNATLSPTSLTFSTQAIGTTSSVKTVTLTNMGTTTLNITSIAITGTNAGDFSQTHTCGNSLASTASCTISVTFKPTASGTRTAAVSVIDNASGSPQKMALTGTSTAANFSPTILNFGTIVVGTASGAQNVTLSNVGTTTFNISAIAITGSDPGDFSQTRTCGTSLTPSASCTISVTFKPTTTGTRTAAISVTDSAVGSRQTVSLSGTGTVVKLSPTTLRFGCHHFCIVPLGCHCYCNFFSETTLTNVGSVPLDITGIAISGPFSEQNTCPTSLGAGNSCAISVTWLPRITGSGEISISDNGGGSPQTVPLTGYAACSP